MKTRKSDHTAKRPLDEVDDLEIIAVKRVKTTNPSRTSRRTVLFPDEGSDLEIDGMVSRPKRVRRKAPIVEEDDVGVDEFSTPNPKKSKNKGKTPDKERRMKRFKENPPRSYWEIHTRAMTQRMFVIERRRSGTEECPEEEVELAGTTGNIYTVKISKVLSCDCPHARKGNHCKHVVYVMCRVLRAPESLQYQTALLSSELRDILGNAPPILGADNTSRDGNRKPIEGDCPICCTEYEPEKEHIVWCKAACGNNIHKGCFEQWAATKKGSSGGVTCPFCRTPWMGDEDMIKNIAKSGVRNAEGYVNVATELGISGQRDYSTYHSFWVRRRRRNGLEVGDWEDPDPDHYYPRSP